MAKATGIGGIFFKYRDEKAMRKWFQTALGLTPNDYGILFDMTNPSQKKEYLQFGTFPESSDYFGKASQQTMINFKVDDLVKLEEHLRSIGTVICDTMEVFDYGKFLHIEDPEGNRIELWEPVNKEFEGEASVEV